MSSKFFEKKYTKRTTLPCPALHCTALNCTAQQYNASNYTALNYNVLINNSAHLARYSVHMTANCQLP